jgi:hypothetical protein
MHRIIIIISTIIAAGMLATPAVAARPPLDPARADKAATRWADETVTVNVDSETYGPDGEVLDATVSIRRYDLDPCELDSRSRASCDVTYIWTDGDECDATIIIETTRRGRLRTRETDWTCDSDAATG